MTGRTVRVYPRVCGGTLPGVLDGVSLDGLSPRVRGNHDRAAPGVHVHRSIPACAGEPLMSIESRPPSWVYPRVCGGTKPAAGGSYSSPGLSPRVRGNPGRRAGGGQGRGSIPACAGEPWSPRPRRGRPRVYPRVCGGTEGVKTMADARAGLSPRVRGNRGRGLAPRPNPGSIPACAGEPAIGSRRSRGWRVYPRVCGGTLPSGYVSTP